MRALLALLLLLATALGNAQTAPADVVRVVIVPFDADVSMATYTLGLPTALQRSLNEVPGVFVPALGDVALVMQKAREAGLDVMPTVRRLFNATVLIDGTLGATAGTVGVNIRLHAADDSVTQLSAQSGDGTPAGLARAAAAAVARAIMPDLGATVLERVNAAAAQTPSLPSLGPVALAASRLPGARVDDLATARQLDTGSAWVASEYARLLAISGDTEASITAAQGAVSAQPTDVEAQTILGIVLTSAGQVDAAKAAFEAALALNPAHAVALTGLARVEADRTAASASLEAAISAYPRMVDAYLQLAALQDNDQRAAQVLRRGESALPESLVLRRSIVQRVVNSGDGRGALAYLQQAVQDPLASSAALYSLVRYLPAELSDEALALLRQGEAAFPDSIDLKVAEGNVLLAAGKHAEVLALLEPLHTQEPSNVAVGELLAVAQARTGDVAGARATFESVAGTTPDAARDLGLLFLAAGRADAALEVLEPLATGDAPSAATLTYYGIALGRSGRLQDAKTALEAALAQQPGLALAQRSLSLLEQQDRLTGGTRVAFDPDAGAAFQQGLYALEVEDYAAAAAAFARARAIADNGLLAFYAGYTAQLTGDVRKAVADYAVAVKDFPDSDIVLNNLGYGHLQLGRYDLALDQLKQALAANPDNARAHLNIGLTYYGLGRWQDAVDAFARAVALDPALEPNLAAVRDAAEERVAQDGGP